MQPKGTRVGALKYSSRGKYVIAGRQAPDVLKDAHHLPSMQSEAPRN